MRETDVSTDASPRSPPSVIPALTLLTIAAVILFAWAGLCVI
jgi:hypothetical protein